MGRAVLNSMALGSADLSTVGVMDSDKGKALEIVSIYGCEIVIGNKVPAHYRNILLLVKPQDIDNLLMQIGESINANQRVISFAAGRKTSGIEKFLKDGVPVIRVMPNTPMSVGIGASAISKGQYATNEDVKAVQELLKASGKTIVIDESLQDAVTATSGSGPAYFFRFVEAMISGAQDLGLSEADARTLVIQTITGAAAMLNQEGADPGVLRQNVTSPNGTTSAALQVFEGGDLEGLVKRAMKAARDRSQELS
ncbi:MAG: pyrroline-5-carboxylate reductase [Actinobacteria bacterium]|nr:pyrroline-5-carboxylate reductase [Actinomycetota bacterium]